MPFPVWHCQDCQHIILADEKNLPVDPQEQKPSREMCPKCSSKNITPDTDIMDTWNTSSLSPLVNVKWPQKSPDGLTLPMSLRPQAHDIIRTWAFYTIVKSFYHFNTIPWQNIMISGHVLAGKEKISKSKGNQQLEPELLLKTYPADVIRFWTAKGTLGTDTAFSENQLKIGQKLVTKLWNAFRFCSEHIQNYNPSSKQQILDALNKWLLHELNKTIKHYTEQLDEYEYSRGLEIVEHFFWHNFCDNYLELIKDRFFNPGNYSKEIITDTQHTLYEVCFAILQLYAPFLPHITETLYQLFFKNHEQTKSLHISIFDVNRYAYDFENDAMVVEKILELVSAVRKLKSEQNLSLKTELELLTVYADDQALLDQLKAQASLLVGITKAKTIEFGQGSNKELVLSGELEHLKAEVQL
ncbi:MAG: class I tRNA ligase family protein [bacterium]